MRLPKITENQTVCIEFGPCSSATFSDRSEAKRHIREQGRHTVTAVKVYEDGQLVSEKTA